MELGAQGLVYCSDAAKTARTSLLNDHGWSITGDSDCSPAPVEMLFIEAKKMKSKLVELTWATASESENKGFEIQQSRDGVEWTRIGFQKGNGNSVVTEKYKFYDKNPIIGVNYYRLKQIDFDGNYDYSNTVTAVIDSPTLTMEVSPNPSNGMVTVRVNNEKKQTVKLTLSDYLGRTIWQRVSNDLTQKGETDLVFNCKGIFLLKVQTGDAVVVKRLVISF